MADYTELVKKLRNYASFTAIPPLSVDLSEAADAIEELQQEKETWKAVAKAIDESFIELANEPYSWIPVTERLPEDFKAVLVYTPKFLNQFMAYHKDDGWRVWSPQDNHGVPFINGQGEITHWMPLPKAPEEE